MKLVREHIEFKQGGNPYNTLGIGKRALMEKWFKDWAPDVYYTIGDSYHIVVDDNLDLHLSPVTHLPDNLEVVGWLDLRNNPISILPNNLTVHKILAIEHTNITMIPDSLNANEIWINQGMKITNLPNDIYYNVSENIYRKRRV